MAQRETTTARGQRVIRGAAPKTAPPVTPGQRDTTDLGALARQVATKRAGATTRPVLPSRDPTGGRLLHRARRR